MTQPLKNFALLNDLYTLAVNRANATQAAILWNCILQMAQALEQKTKVALAATTTMETN